MTPPYWQLPERLGAKTFYSEDLNHNQIYGSVQVINPFLEG